MIKLCSVNDRDCLQVDRLGAVRSMRPVSFGFSVNNRRAVHVDDANRSLSARK